MFMAFFSWWYGEGWQRQLHMVTTRIAGMVDLFSIDLLIRTLFAPFRQISAGRVDGPVGVQLQAFVDKIISRFIGALVRTAVLIAGVIAIAVTSFVSMAYLAVWPFMPFLFVIGILTGLSGWLRWP